MADTHVPLPDSRRGRKPDAARVGEVDPVSAVEVTVTVRPEQFPTDSAEVSRILGQFGLSVDATYPATGSLVVSGTAAQITEAFRPGLAMYDHGPDGVLRGREAEVHVPSALSSVITGVFGLDQRRVARRRVGLGPKAARRKPLGPRDLERRYRFPRPQGDGQTIAIAEFGGGYYPDDLRLYCQQCDQAVPRIEIVSVGASPLTPTEIAALSAEQQGPALGESHEVMMDVQIVAGLCPRAKICVFFAPFDQKGWIDLLDRVAAEDPPPVSLCVSWGLAEDSTDWSPAAVDAINRRLRAVSRRGITVCAASGDDGAGDQMHDDRAHVHFPASSPYVLAIGGTMLKGADEVVWWNAPGDRSQPHGGSTGGGVSARFKRPEWQNVSVHSLNPGGFDGRVVPDVAALAGLPGYRVVFDGQARMNGGTSASAPLWAALVARIAASAPSKPPAFLTPLLYQQGPDGRVRGVGAFKDITKGNNTTPQPGFGYEADEGFDAVTGWGVPNGRLLLASL